MTENSVQTLLSVSEQRAASSVQLMRCYLVGGRLRDGIVW